MTPFQVLVLATAIVAAAGLAFHYRANAQVGGSDGFMAVSSGGGSAFVVNGRTGTVTFCASNGCKKVGRAED